MATESVPCFNFQETLIDPKVCILRHPQIFASFVFVVGARAHQGIASGSENCCSLGVVGCCCAFEPPGRLFYYFLYFQGAVDVDGGSMFCDFQGVATSPLKL